MILVLLIRQRVSLASEPMGLTANNWELSRPWVGVANVCGALPLSPYPSFPGTALPPLGGARKPHLSS